MRFLVVLALCYAVVAGAPRNPERIVGGELTTINSYPGIAALLFSRDLVTYRQDCGGSIINTRTILSAAHCTQYSANQYRVRVGSTFSNSGGTVHQVERVTNHPSYNIAVVLDADISILRTATTIVYGNTVNAATFAGANYNVADNAVVWAAGWGVTETGTLSEQLRHAQLWIVNQGICNGHYGIVNSNMICSGNQGTGRGQCNADSGGPLYHNGIVVGVTSFGPPNCADPIRPVVSARVSSFITWIQANA